MMQVASSMTINADRFSDLAAKFDHVLGIRSNDEQMNDRNRQEQEAEHFLQEEKAGDGDGDREFSFACSYDSNSPIAAEDLFHNGQIRPLITISGGISGNDPPVKNVFVTPPATVLAPEMSKKCNSTGFSKLRKVKELLLRSHSDGSDALVFMAREKGETSSFSSKKAETKSIAKVKKSKTTSSEKREMSAYEMHYGKKIKEGGERRKSYLPYRQELVGFFTNTSSMSRNVHPY